MPVVRELKGEGRPVNTENDRAVVVAALQSVDGVCVFSEKSANRFLGVACPDIYVKGGDYTLDTINQEERRTVESAGGKSLHPTVCPRQIHYDYSEADRQPVNWGSLEFFLGASRQECRTVRDLLPEWPPPTLPLPWAGPWPIVHRICSIGQWSHAPQTGSSLWYQT